MSATQHDVAALAGVARKTVSNVINGYQFVSPDVRARVTAAIAELDYRPNHVARSLRSGRSKVIGLVVPELDVAYFAELARAVVVEAERRGFRVMITQTLGDREREVSDVAGTTVFVEGLIYSPVALSGREIAELPKASPLVLLGERPADGVLDHVGVDNVAAARAAVEHLLSRGRRRVLFVGSSPRPDNDIGRLRAQGYREALEGAGLAHDSALVVDTAGYHQRHGREAVQGLLASGQTFDAAFCATDLLAQGVIRALFDAGLHVPDDVAVAGFDDIDEGRYSIPTLTTVAPDKAAIAATAVMRLLERIEDPQRTPSEHTVGFTLEVRESSGGLAAGPRAVPASRRRR